MSSSRPNPVLAPIRRWVLYSRTNLVITVVGVAAVLFATGAVVGQDPSPRPAAEPTDTAVAAAAESISYDLEEVSESLVTAKTSTWVAASAPATAMAYAHAFVDPAPSDTAWAAALGRYTTTKPEAAFLAARPRTSVVITGPTTSTLVDRPEGTPRAHVTVPTQAADLRISLVVAEMTGQTRWVVDSPLPTLDLSDVDQLVPTTPTVVPRPSSTTEPTEASSPRPTPAPSTTPDPSVDLDLNLDFDEPTGQPNLLPSRGNDPTPVPGPIPIPELDTPIPGGR